MDVQIDGEQRSATGSLRQFRAVLPFACALLSGVLLSACFAPWNQEWLCWFALTPLIAALWFCAHNVRSPGLRHAQLGYLNGVTFFLGTFHWLTTVHWIGWIALSLYLGLYLAFWGWFIGSVIRERQFLSSGQNLLIAIGGASAWVLQEWVRGWLFTGFGWNGLGVSLHKNLIYIQIAEITGVSGLTFLIVLCNLIAVITVKRFISEFGRVRFRPHYDFSVTMILLAVTFGFGFRSLVKQVPTTPLSVAAIQANIPQNQKFDAAFEQKIFERYTAITNTALKLQPQLLLWPEAATPRGMFADETNYKFVMGLAERGDYNFLLGSLDFDDAGDYNIAALLTERGKTIQVYRKNHLVPFGEFIPFRKSFPLFAWIAGDLVPADFKPGTSRIPLQLSTPDLKIAPLICFEDTLSYLSRAFVLNGAQLLVNVTNDGWFLESAGAEQHLANAVFRAVETRRPLLRSANTGVTCFIDQQGRITHQLRGSDGSPFLEGFLYGQVAVPTEQALTFYVRHGHHLPLLAGAIVVLMILRRFMA